MNQDWPSLIIEAPLPPRPPNSDRGIHLQLMVTEQSSFELLPCLKAPGTTFKQNNLWVIDWALGECCDFFL